MSGSVDAADVLGKASQSTTVSWPRLVLHRSSSQALSRPPFAMITTCESASRAENAREAAKGFDPKIKVVLLLSRNVRIRDAPPFGDGNAGEDDCMAARTGRKICRSTYLIFGWQIRDHEQCRFRDQYLLL